MALDLPNWAVPVVCAIASAGGVAAVFKYRLGKVEERVSVVEKKASRALGLALQTEITQKQLDKDFEEFKVDRERTLQEWNHWRASISGDVRETTTHVLWIRSRMDELFAMVERWFRGQGGQAK